MSLSKFLTELKLDIACLFGRHRTKLTVYQNKRVFAVGGKCTHCGCWVGTVKVVDKDQLMEEEFHPYE